MAELWSDERMRSRVNEHKMSLDYGTQVNTWAKVAFELRDDYQQRIAELEDTLVVRDNLIGAMTLEQKTLDEDIERLKAENASMKAQSDAFVAGWFARNTGKAFDQCPVDLKSPEGQWWSKGWQWRDDSLENAQLRKDAIESAIHNAGLEAIEKAQVAAYDELTRLRSRLPGNDVLFAITMLAMMHDGSEHSRVIAAWLDNMGEQEQA